MLMMLAGLPGKMKTLLDRLTAARAGNLDRLDATVSSRAPASTALLRAVWSDARAASLDLITAARMEKIDAMPAQYDPRGRPPIQIVRNTTGANATNGTTTMVNVTGSGVVSFVHGNVRGASNRSTSMTLAVIVDGVEFSANAFSTTETAVREIPVIGDLKLNFFPEIVFSSSLVIRRTVSTDSTSPGYTTVDYAYRRVA